MQTAKQPDQLTNPCRVCDRLDEDKRYGRCAACEKPLRYAIRMEARWAHLPQGIDTSEVKSVSGGMPGIKQLTECRMIL